jgi:hypothetical protein
MTAYRKAVILNEESIPTAAVYRSFHGTDNTLLTRTQRSRVGRLERSSGSGAVFVGPVSPRRAVGVKPRLVDEESRLLLGFRPVLMAGQDSSRHRAIAASSN